LPLSHVILGSFLRVFGMTQWGMLPLDNYKTIVTDVLLWRSLNNTVIIGGGAATGATSPDR